MNIIEQDYSIRCHEEKEQEKEKESELDEHKYFVDFTSFSEVSFSFMICSRYFQQDGNLLVCTENFSNASYIMTVKRANLSDKALKVLFCIHAWMQSNLEEKNCGCNI